MRLAMLRLMDVRMLEPDESADAGLVGRITDLINSVYAAAEEGLWQDGTRRATPAEVAGMIHAEEIAVAREDDRVVGSVRVHEVAEGVGEFGYLVSAPDVRGTGAGRALLDFAEERGRERGLRTMQLELLVPRDGVHPNKEFLKGWYARRGYREVRTAPVNGAYPHLAPLLAVPCDFAIYEKVLY
jgi:GNAT superfamily N-acetyltransferase